MDFKDSIRQISKRIEDLKDSLQTEEATKVALVMPFIRALEYDVFNPLEVIPEMCCDIGTKKGEKIDYAIMKDGEPIILIECKHWQEDLNLHDNQLLRYFNVSAAKFGVLTNGIIYRFYTDLEEPNKMDKKPFLEINLSNPKDAQIEELKRFHRSYFNIEEILSSANELKYMNELRCVISNEFTNPSQEFVRCLCKSEDKEKRLYNGVFTASVQEQFTILVKRSINNYINDIISERLKVAIQENEMTMAKKNTETDAEQQSMAVPDNMAFTTQEELEGYYIVKSILRNVFSPERITHKDTRSYFGVSIDNNVRKTVCRFYFDPPSRKRLAIIDENKSEKMYKLNSINDIYNYADTLIEAANKYL